MRLCCLVYCPKWTQAFASTPPRCLAIKCVRRCRRLKGSNSHVHSLLLFRLNSHYAWRRLQQASLAQLRRVNSQITEATNSQSWRGLGRLRVRVFNTLDTVRNRHLAPYMLASWHGPSFQLLVLTSLEYYSYSHNHVANTLFNRYNNQILMDYRWESDDKV